MEFSNLKIILKLKIIFKQLYFKQLYCSLQKVCSDITPAKLFFKNGGLLTYSSVSQILNLVSECASDPPPQGATDCNNQEKFAGGRWGILNKSMLLKLKNIFVITIY